MRVTTEELNTKLYEKMYDEHKHLSRILKNLHLKT